MKNLLLILLVSSISMAQSHIEVRLVNGNVGTPQCGYYFNDWLCNSTNDSGLNTILSNYGVSYFRELGGHPYPPYQGTIFSVSNSTNDAQLASDLSAYSGVVANAILTTIQGFTDALDLTLADANIGTPTGTSGNIIVTNDAGLNQVFQDFHVFFYTRQYPSITWPNFDRYYTLACDCDASALQIAINNLTAVSTSNLIQGVILTNNQFEKPKAIISPNPFSTNFDIQTDQTITNYSIIDIDGKTIINTTSKTELVNQSPQLSAGMYILNLNFDNGQKANYKLVKK
jgi:hypothetical protein